MTELFLNFKDENGENVSVCVEGESFTVGRNSACDLCIPNPCLSREHLKFERYGDVFVVSDLGSSNGSTFNGSPLDAPVGIKDGDALILGGGLKMGIRLESDAPTEYSADPASPGVDMAGAAAPPQAQVSADSSGISIGLFIIAPLLLLVVLVFTGGAIFLLSGGNTSAGNGQDDIAENYDDDEPRTKRNDDDNSETDSKPSPAVKTKDQSDDGNSTDTANSNTIPSGELTEIGKAERYGTAFLRKIAHNDPKAFLTTDQARQVSEKAKQLSGSAAIAANISQAKKNASQIRSLAAEKNLKPDFLAVAAIMKLGNSRGDILQTARGMTEILDKLGTQIGNELAEDSLMVIAAYGQGEAGDFMKLRNMLQDIATKSSASSREIRTIWFLEKNNRITAAEFDRALTFLAIGAITQNPKDFNVNSEALVF